MAENKYKEFHRNTPVENHSTAAWANIERVDEVSGISIPSEMQVINAKEYVDENEK